MMSPGSALSLLYSIFLKKQYFIRLLVYLGILIFIFFFNPYSMEGEYGFKLIVCPFRNFTGLPCPGCGITRAVYMIAHGKFAEAMSLNPFAPVIIIILFIEIVNSIAGIIRKGNPFFKWKTIFENKIVNGFALLIASSAIIYNIFRIWQIIQKADSLSGIVGDSIIYRLIWWFSSFSNQ